MTVIMGQLPSLRDLSSSPFNITAIDYSGPFTLKKRKGRGFKHIKRIQTAMAIYLDVVSDIAAIRRFYSRRGKSFTLDVGKTS